MLQEKKRLYERGVMNEDMLLRGVQRPMTLSINNFPETLGGKLRDTILLFDNFDEQLVSTEKKQQIQFPQKNSDVMFFIVISGAASLMINMEVVEIAAGQVLGIMPGSVFQGKERSNDFQFLCFSMTSELYDSLLKTVGVYVALPDRYARYIKVDIDQDISQATTQMYRIMKHELSEPDYPRKRMVMQRYCEIMLLKCIYRVETNKPSEQPESTPSRRVQIYRDFLSLLEKNFRRERSISFYAEKLCITPKYLSTVVKEVSGKHGSQWIDDYLVMEAKALLRQGQYNIKQVSDILCFPSQSMFGRFFKKMTGYSPREYKQL